MPGIFGLITKKPYEEAQRELAQMQVPLQHESFYTTGTWSNKETGVYVGWVARKGSFSEQMPICNEAGDVVLVFTGEDFPEEGIQARLKEMGHRVSTNRAGYLVHLYEEDPEFWGRLNGRFHGCLVDGKHGSVTLFNDRFGMHRLYIYESKDALYFACEAKSILAVKPETREIDPQGLGQFIACGCVMDNRTLFRGVRILPPASRWVFQNTELRQRESYFEPREWEEQPLLDEESYYRELRNIFSNNLARYFSSPEKIAMSMTGGLDTRMIMAWRRSSPGSLPCYTFGGMFRDCHDVRLGKKIAELCGESHQVIQVGEEFLRSFPEHLEKTVYTTDGCATALRSSNVYVNKKAREIGSVRMTGNYGGEVLRRIRMFKPIMPAPGLFHGDLTDYLHNSKETYAELIQCHPLTFTAFRQAPWHHYALMALEETQISVRTPYLDNEFVRTAFRAPKSSCTENICLRLITEGNPQLGKIPTDRGVNGDRGGFTSLFRHNLLEFSFKAEYAYDYGMPQWLARVDHALAPLHLERLFLGRHKYYHYRVWYRDQLANYLMQVLLDSRSLSRPYVQRQTVEAIVERHIKGEVNYTWEIHILLTLELLHRLMIDSAPIPLRVVATAN